MSQILGQTLGDRYRIVSLLGSGGMGEVYLAEHVVLGKRMAVKVLKADFSRDDELVQRFQQEAVAASRIGHENIVSVTDFGRTPHGAFYFVMEALAGTDLASLIRGEGILPLARSLPILIYVSRALGAAHAQGIVHRDLKAENVMVVPRDDGTDLVKVLDFGISKMSAAEDSRITRQGVLMGTPNYMSPEQARGETVDSRSDIYSFGILTYELLTATVPFTAPSVATVLVKHMTEPPEPPSRRRLGMAALPQELEALVMRMLEKDPAKRPQSMAEVREVLVRSLQENATSTPLPILLTTPLPGPLPVADSVGRKERPAVVDRTWVTPRPRAKPRRWPWVVFGAGVLSLLGAGAATLLLRPRPLARPASEVTAAAVPVVAHPAPATLSTPPEPTESIAAIVPDPPPSHPSPSPVAGPHRITVKDIQRVFGRSSAKLRKCLQDNRTALPGRAGAIAVSFTVVKSGSVKSAEITTPGAHEGALAKCVTARVAEMKFPPHAENAVAFEIPLAYDFRD